MKKLVKESLFEHYEPYMPYKKELERIPIPEFTLEDAAKESNSNQIYVPKDPMTTTRILRDDQEMFDRYLKKFIDKWGTEGYFVLIEDQPIGPHRFIRWDVKGNKKWDDAEKGIADEIARFGSH